MQLGSTQPGSAGREIINAHAGVILVKFQRIAETLKLRLNFIDVLDILIEFPGKGIKGGRQHCAIMVSNLPVIDEERNQNTGYYREQLEAKSRQHSVDAFVFLIIHKRVNTWRVQTFK